MIKEIIDKISSYNLFNYLLPGTIFVFVAGKTTSHDYVQENLLIAGFLYYFIGLVISRIGSLVVEPILIKVRFVKFAKYEDFVAYSKKDDKINIISEGNNMYRTLIALFLSLISLRGVDWIFNMLHFSNDMKGLMLFTFLLALFLFAYRKQTSYITKRINSNK